MSRELRFYRIIPTYVDKRGTNTDTHALLGGTDRWTHETYYPSMCGENIYGSVCITKDVADVTCSKCQVEFVANRLKQEDMEDDLQALADSLTVVRKAGAPAESIIPVLEKIKFTP